MPEQGTGILTGMPRQGIIGPTARQPKALGDLAGAAWPCQQLRGLNLSPKFCPNHTQQNDGCSLLPALLIGRGDLLQLWETGQAAWNKKEKL